MTFSSLSESYFLAETRNRGADYSLQKRVSIQIVNKMAAHAIVRASKSYHCSFEAAGLDEGDDSLLLQMDCDCPQFTKGYSCKHLWASHLPSTLILGPKR